MDQVSVFAQHWLATAIEHFEPVLASARAYTSDLPLIVRAPLVALLGEKCYNELVVDLSIFESSECMRSTFNNVLGLGVVAGAAFVKIPQITKILRSRSGRGISALGLFLESISCWIGLAYCYRHQMPFASYGELVFLSLQNSFLVWSVLFYTRRSIQALGSVLLIATIAYSLISPQGHGVSDAQLVQLQLLTMALYPLSRIPQIWMTYKAKSCGQLAFMTILLSVFGSSARLFTLLKINDSIPRVQATVGLTLNLIMMLQFALYGSKKGKSQKKRNQKSKVISGKDIIENKHISPQTKKYPIRRKKN